MSAVLLSARGLCKAYGANRVTDDLSFEVRQGETLAILGPNGAGKTTLFNLISGDVSCDQGELSFDGRTLRREAPFERCRLGIGRTYQIPRPYVGMTAFEVGLRPEHLRLVAESGAALSGSVRLVERLGNQTLVHVATKIGMICVQGAGRLPVSVGDPAGIAFDPALALVFDESGRRQ